MRPWGTSDVAAALAAKSARPCCPATPKVCPARPGG